MQFLKIGKGNYTTVPNIFYWSAWTSVRSVVMDAEYGLALSWRNMQSSSWTEACCSKTSLSSSAFQVVEAAHATGTNVTPYHQVEHRYTWKAWPVWNANMLTINPISLLFFLLQLFWDRNEMVKCFCSWCVLYVLLVMTYEFIRFVNHHIQFFFNLHFTPIIIRVSDPLV